LTTQGVVEGSLDGKKRKDSGVMKYCAPKLIIKLYKVNKKKIRPTALLLAIKNNKVLVIKAHDYCKNENFYRLIGGGIEFGETGVQALAREIKEEVNTEIKNIKYLGLIENIFNYENKDKHEIVLVYKAEFIDKSIYGKREINILDSRNPQKAFWVNKEELKKFKFYPEEIKKLIK